ncbi:MAG: sel1 repeat family protein, partial [Rhodospirillales bacterium]|nr:sel1 repeat family protein [Rhodospirillales bacterium]
MPVSSFAKIILVGAALFLGLSSGAAADYKGAIKAAQIGDYISALREFKELSKKGHPPSQYSIAVMYHFGRGQPRDFAEAIKWYDLAVKSDYAPALNNLATIYRFGQGVKIDYERAFEMYRKAAPEHSLAKYNLGDMYSKG